LTEAPVEKKEKRGQGPSPPTYRAMKKWKEKNRVFAEFEERKGEDCPNGMFFRRRKERG